MAASDEMRAAAVAYRARGSPGDARIADLLEQAAQKAAAREGIWQLAGYSPQEQTQLAECWWRHELTIARALPRSGERTA
ncbi:MAG: hypothetical protein JO287_15205 [Pseudonocardiales bacterium]|nr:hypothetical protein [Pseudonocardiales bacterium]